MIALPLLEVRSLKLAAGIACALLLAMLIHDRNHWKAKTAHYADLLSAERSAHDATVANYRAAAEQARREDAESVARVKAAQAAISERTENDYENRTAAARAAAGSMRGEGARAAAHRGSGRAAPVPGLPAAAQGAPQAAGENGLPPADRLIATEQAIQLDELVKWVRAQSEIRPTGDLPARK